MIATSPVWTGRADGDGASIRPSAREMSQENSDIPPAAPPAAAGPAGPRFEGKVGAFYFLALLAGGEPRGLPGAVTRKVRFQQSAHGRPLDDVTVDAVNADGSDAFLDIQAKRTIDFTAGNQEFADVVRRLWATARKPTFAASRYELAVAIARTSTRIERDCQQVLQWARQLADAASFAAHMQRRGFASDGMRAFVDAFRHHLANAGAPVDDETVWRLLRRFKILVFDFESPGSDYDSRAREQGRALLALEQAHHAADLWAVLTDAALACDAAGGEMDRPSLVRDLEQIHGFRLGDRPDLRPAHARLSEASDDALADIKDDISGARLSRRDLIDAADGLLEQHRVVQIVGASGVGKSAILKSLALRQRSEGTIIVLSPGRIPSGGWTRMAQIIGCPVDRNELFNELGCGGGATLFIDNIDQIEDADAWPTLRDLLRSVMESPGWRAIFTVRSDDQEWRANLPDEMQSSSFGIIRVNPLSDAEAEVLRLGNPALSALLSNTHPARAMARNLFYLSRLANLPPPSDEAAPVLANELDLAGLWWRFGGGRSETGKFGRLKLLRNLGERLIAQPGLAAFPADELDSEIVEELLRADSLRENRAGVTVAFWHDTLRDWTIGFLLDEKPELRAALPTSHPLPGTLARGVEIAARLALASDATGARWLSLLEEFERGGCHGSWRRPVLMALPRSENAIDLFDNVEAALVADRGRRLRDILHLIFALEAEPIANIVARLPVPLPAAGALDASFVIPTGRCWLPVVVWVLMRVGQLPSALIPDLAKLFQAWLLGSQSQMPHVNAVVVEKLYDWLTQIEEAKRPIAVTDICDIPRFDLDFENMNRVRDDIRMTFLSFCHFRPDLAAQYLTGTDPHDRDARDILRFPGSVVRAAPAALADFALKVLIPEDDEDDSLYRRGRDRFGPFGVYDTDFIPTSPRQGPFFELLESAPAEGLRLVRGIVGHATQWYREAAREDGHSFPSLTIAFPDGPKTLEGHFGIYQWARGGTGALVAASALMALEAWAHRQLESGRPFAEVLHDVLGPSGSSIAFVCVAADLVLSHWEAAKEAAWPMLAVPELLNYDRMRFEQDIAGLGRFSVPEREKASWRVKAADLAARPSRRLRLIDVIGDLGLPARADLRAQLRSALDVVRERIAGMTLPDDQDRFNGVRATAERAWRMMDRSNWISKTVRRPNGEEVEGYEFKLTAEEMTLLEAGRASSTAGMTETSTRWQLQKALSGPAASTPAIVADGIRWAKERAATTVNNETEDDSEDRFHREWQGRAVVMAAALAARDYGGEDRGDVVAWCTPILDEAATGEADDISARVSEQIYSNGAAIAAVGYIGLCQRDQNQAARDALLNVAARQDHAVLNAIGSHLTELRGIDARLPRSLVRLILNSVSHPRRTLDADEDAANKERHRRKVGDAVAAEKRWLDAGGPEPEWPELPPWHSRRRRGFRIGGHDLEERPSPAERRGPEMYVDEHALGILAGHLVPFTLGELEDWAITLARHLMNWTIPANNGPPGDDEDERENRPFAWNISYFNFLGILCVALPFARAREWFMEPMTRLHEEAFNDATAAFLRGFDHATLAPDAGEPEDPVAVRALIADRLRRGRMAGRLSDRVSFTAETHLGDALTAMFYQPSRWEGRTGPYIPARWDGLPGTMPILTELAASVPKSGYVAVLFLTLVESYPCAVLLRDVVRVASAWRGEHAVGAQFWTEHQIGHRVCVWIDEALKDEPAAFEALTQVQDDLGKCLDVLVRSGLASARTLEARIAEDGRLRKAG